MSTIENKSEIVEKIRKLLNLSKSSNRHEAELAAQRASELMQKHQIANSVIEASSLKSGKERVADAHFQVPDLRMKYQWVVHLGHAAASLFDGTILVERRLHGTGFIFVGFQSEIPLMREMFLHLYNAWSGFVNADLLAAKADHWGSAPWAPRDTMKFKHGHGQGYADALYSRCVALAEERRVKVSAASNSCTALVLVRGEAVTAYLKQQGVRTVKIKQTNGRSDGQSAGWAAGARVALGGALKGGADRSRIQS